MAFSPKINGRKPAGMRGEALVAAYRAGRGMTRIPTRDTAPTASLGGVPLADTVNPLRERPFFAAESPKLRGDGRLAPTTGPSVKATVTPVDSRDYRRRIANARAGHAARAADGAGLQFAKGRNTNPLADTVPTPERQTTMGERQIPGQINMPYSLTSRPVEIDSRIYQGQQTAGYRATRFF